MSDAPGPRSRAPVTETESETPLWAVTTGESQPCGEPNRSLAALRLLVRERMKVYGTPLPEGYQLPPGITLEELLKPPPKTGPV
jgi:hypothetical protein